MSKTIYITTAIDYANGAPHLGHAYEKVLADVIARIHLLQGDRVHFLTGLDEHGQKVQQTAEKRGIEPQMLCDEIALSFKKLCKALNISYNDYIRTTETRHKDYVAEKLQVLYNSGDIYKAQYKGFYSTKEEQFLQEKDQVDGKWPEHFGEVLEMEESNYFFKLSKHRDWLIDYIENNPYFIYPKSRAKQVLGFLKEPINDLCISRPKERLHWGIPLPFDEHYVTYVWFDALLNYLSAPSSLGTGALENYWPADYHIIGKDILVPAHAIYWPIMLKALDIPLPKQLLVHGWWLMKGTKMSKSFGNSVDPFAVIDWVGADAFRYFLIREMQVGQDSDFSFELLLQRYNSDLGNDLGNLLSRLLNMTTRYTGGTIPESTANGLPEEELQTFWEKQRAIVLENYKNKELSRGLEELFAFIRAINRYTETRAPWKLAKEETPEAQALLNTTLGTMAEALRLASVLLIPIIPKTAETIFTHLGASAPKSWEGSLVWNNPLTGKTTAEKCILFPRVEAPAHA